MAAAKSSSGSFTLLDVMKGNHIAGDDEFIREESPELAIELDREGNTALHLACHSGRMAVVSLLIGSNPQLCLVKDTHERTPLHTAAMKGRVGVVEELLRACLDSVSEVSSTEETPLHAAVRHLQEEVLERLLESIQERSDFGDIINRKKAIFYGRVDEIRVLVSVFPISIEELTSMEQTVFHLAAKFCVPEVFAVLLEEAEKFDKGYLLGEEDCHISVSNKQLRIVKRCLPDPSSTTPHGFSIRVKAMNMKGETALDLCLKIPDPDNETGHIGRILYESSHCEEVSLFDHRHRHPKRSTTHPWHTLETKNVLLVVLTLFIALAFSVTCALPTFFPKESMPEVGSVFEFKDLMYGQLPLNFYIIFFITVLLTTSTSILSVLLYSFPCGSLMLLGGFATFVLYLLLAYFTMPKFTVRVGFRRLHVTSYYLMLILALSFIFIGVPLIYMANWVMVRSYNHLKRVTTKVVRKIRSPSNMNLPLRNPSSKIQMFGNAILASTSTANN